jgi:uncharacterized membrane protein
MGRTSRAKNKDIVLPVAYTLTAEQRLQILVGLLVEILAEEEKCSPNS